MRPKLLFLVTEDWYFCSHRLPPARAAKCAGFDIVVATRVHRDGGRILSEGFRLLPIRLRRRSWNPVRELAALLEIIRIYWRERPDVVHHLALKPTLYGSLAARIARVPGVINALPGLGLVFSSGSLKARSMRACILLAFRMLLNRPGAVLILQNPDDVVRLTQAALQPHRVRLIRGSGVDLKRYAPSAEPAGKPIVLLASRMLWEKGVGEFVEAAAMLRASGATARFVLVGDSDGENPAAIPPSQLKRWNADGIVEWWGHCDDMPGVLRGASVVCLPSAYGEGVPKVLLEAAACARCIVATDAAGCREIVRHRENGLLVPIRDAAALAAAIAELLSNRELRLAMGRRGRELVESEFSDELVARQTLAVYREVAPAWAS